MSIRGQYRTAYETSGQPSGWSRFAFLSNAALGAFGRNGYFLAAAWLLAERGHGSAGVAIFVAIVSAAEFIFSPAAGLLADRFNKWRLQVAADIGRFAVSIATALALSNMSPLSAMCMSAALFSFFDRVALTANQSIIPAIVVNRDSVTWNSIVVLVMQAGNFAAALLIGMLLVARAPAPLFTILGCAFLFAAIIIASVKTPAMRRGGNPDRAGVWDVKPGFLRLVAVNALFYASALLVSVIGSTFVFAELKGTAADFGLFEAAWSIGSLLGAISLAVIRPRMSADTRHMCLLGMVALTFIALRFPHASWTILLFALVGFLYNLGRVSVEVAFQSRVAGTTLGRAKGVMHSVAVVLSLIVFAVATAVGDRASPSTVFFGFGVMLLIGLFVLAAFHRQPQDKGKS